MSRMKSKAEILELIVREEEYLKGKGSHELSDAIWYERTAAVRALKWVVGLEKKSPEQYPF